MFTYRYDLDDGWYYAENLGDGIWRVSDCGSDNFYVIIGDAQAMVFDTGYGAGNLIPFIRKITDKPLIASMSHCHSDHAGGNGFFDTVYGGRGDMEGLHVDGIEEKRDNVRKNRAFPEGYVLPREKHVPKGGGKMPTDLHGCPARLQTLPAEDGMALDLGGRSVRFLLTPGHSPGSLCLMDQATGTLFTGDTYVPHAYWGPMWLHISHSTRLAVYLQSLWHIAASGAVRMCSGHGECGPSDIADLADYIALVQDIVDGRIRGEPVDTFIGEGLFCACGHSSIIYARDKL